MEDSGLIECKKEQTHAKAHDKRGLQRRSDELVSSLLQLPHKHKKQTPPVLKPPVTPEDMNNIIATKPDHAAQSSCKMVKFTKLSQKERKRLNSEQSSKTSTVDKAMDTDKPKWSGWGSQTPDPINLSDQLDGTECFHAKQNLSLDAIMQSQKPTNSLDKDTKSSDASKLNQSAKKPKAWRVLDFNKPSKQITVAPAPIPTKNPWQITNPGNSSRPNSAANQISKAPDPTNVISSTFRDIMHEEAIQKQNLHRLQSKSLAATQIEEHAIEELKLFYNVDNVFDELITVNRSNSNAMATPVWNPRK